ncbi:hypothetical protein PENTCL1PPCAC_15350, partial [Pristionchus entomophagus]
MPSNKLPPELWYRILYYCDHPSKCSISKVSHRLADVVTEKRGLAIGRCRNRGITLPSDEILSLSFENPDLPLDTKVLKKHNPFGRCISLSPSTMNRFHVEENYGGQAFIGEVVRELTPLERATIDFVLDYESIGIPRWMIDGLRPRIIVSAVLQRCDGAGTRISAKIGVCRLDGMSQPGNFTQKARTL